MCIGLGNTWGSRSLQQTAIEREVNSQLAQVFKTRRIDFVLLIIEIFVIHRYSMVSYLFLVLTVK